MRPPYHYEITITPRLRVECIAEKANSGINAFTIVSSVTMCMAVGNVSFDDRL